MAARYGGGLGLVCRSLAVEDAAEHDDVSQAAVAQRSQHGA
jgi:hypothetical protein